MARIALTCFRKNPKLAVCDPRSVFAAVLTAAQLGWEPGINCYLIPYKRECQLVPDWQALVDLVHRSGRASVWTGAVFAGDEFDYSLGDSPFINHKPLALTEQEDKLTHAYAVGRVNGSDWPVIEVWPIAKIVAHRDRYNKIGRDHYSFDNLEMYARKVALLQVLKYMPKSVEMQMATGLDQAAAKGEQHLDVQDAIESTWTPPEPEPQQEEKKSGTEAVKLALKNRVTEPGQDEIWPKDK